MQRILFLTITALLVGAFVGLLLQKEEIYLLLATENISFEMTVWTALFLYLLSITKSAIETLKARGIKVLMATGDNQQVAKAVSTQLSLDDFYAEVLPEDKQRIIKELQEKGEFVAMTGDGVNDAPALAQANVGIAVGSGTDVAAETADIVLVNSNPKDITNLILFGTATYKKMMQNEMIMFLHKCMSLRDFDNFLR